MTAVFVVVAIAVVGALAVLIARDRPLIADDPVGAPELDWPRDGHVTATTLGDVRFGVVVRGYRMEQVDRVLDDTRAALRDRDAQIQHLEQLLAARGSALGRDLAPAEPAGGPQPGSEATS